MNWSEERRAIAMHEAGRTFHEISAALNASVHVVRMVIDAEYRDRQRLRNRTTKKRKRTAEQIAARGQGKKDHPFVFKADMTPTVRRDAERLMDEVPADTRDITARTFGDPLPGRSALDRRRG